MARRPKRIDLARSLRKQEVPAEARLWRALRSRALAGYKFRRQHPIGPYIVDFACVECKLVVELDGLSHVPRESADRERTKFLEGEGWCVIRFWNTEVYEELEPVKEAVYRECVARSKPG
jgi:very-short-patch-repair endonuclease